MFTGIRITQQAWKIAQTCLRCLRFFPTMHWAHSNGGVVRRHRCLPCLLCSARWSATACSRRSNFRRRPCRDRSGEQLWRSKGRRIAATPTNWWWILEPPSCKMTKLKKCSFGSAISSRSRLYTIWCYISPVKNHIHNIQCCHNHCYWPLTTLKIQMAGSFRPHYCFAHLCTLCCYPHV